MLEACHGLRLLLEAQPEDLVLGEELREHLYGSLPIQAIVVRATDSRHPAPPDSFDDPVLADSITGLEPQALAILSKPAARRNTSDMDAPEEA